MGSGRTHFRLQPMAGQLRSANSHAPAVRRHDRGRSRLSASNSSEISLEIEHWRQRMDRRGRVVSQPRPHRNWCRRGHLPGDLLNNRKPCTPERYGPSNEADSSRRWDLDYVPVYRPWGCRYRTILHRNARGGSFRNHSPKLGLWSPAIQSAWPAICSSSRG